MHTSAMTLTPITTPRPALRALAMLAAFAAAALLATPSQAGASAIRTTTVNFSDINTHSPAGAEALYRRLRAAARQVCDDSSARGIEVRRSVQQCRKDALDRAVAQAAQPLLTALHRKGPRALG
jgi:UrcA family protein